MKAAGGVVFTRGESPRAADPAALAGEYAQRGGGEALAVPDVRAALEAARRKAGPQDLVVVCGSLYLVGEVKRQL